jgi:CO/xanthine dehydrogenase Mo-binding subunit
MLVENADGPGPYGAKGIGESGLMPTAPAIANALDRAMGVRLKALPLTLEHVRTALAGRKRARQEGGTMAQHPNMSFLLIRT